jgi:thiol-disulfide isomerase/thioredoxin
MKKIAMMLGAASLLLLSFIVDPEMARLYFVRTEMSFNTPKTNTEVYIFTDWNCPKCKKLNHDLANIAPELKNQATLYFIDIYPEKAPSLTKVNQALLFNKNKELGQYLKAREKLFELAIKETAFTDEEIKSALSIPQIDFPPEDVLKTATKFFEMMRNNFSIQETPSILIYQLDTQKNQILTASAPEKILAAIHELEQKTDSENRKNNLSKKGDVTNQ